MTKEMKRPISNITQDSIKPLLSNAVEFYTNKNREAHKCIQERDEYINYLESKLSNTKPQQALPVVPECVAELFNEYRLENIQRLFEFGIDDIKSNKMIKALMWRDKHPDTFSLAFITGKYEVENPQLFYLRDELTGQFLAKDNQFKNEDRYFFWTGADPLAHSIGTAWKLTFTQQEIDSMQTGSYEKIEVHMEEEE